MKNKRKGFTLVELLVVIAILAVLATVSIIAYTSFTEKAKKSVDESLCTQYNTLLKAEQANDNDITLAEFIVYIEENGINSNQFKTSSKSYVFAYDKGTTTCVLLDEKTGNVVYPANHNAVELWTVYPESNRLQTGVTNYTLLKPLNLSSTQLWDATKDYKFDLNKYVLEANSEPGCKSLTVTNGYLGKGAALTKVTTSATDNTITVTNPESTHVITSETLNNSQVVSANEAKKLQTKFDTSGTQAVLKDQFISVDKTASLSLSSIIPTSNNKPVVLENVVLSNVVLTASSINNDLIFKNCKFVNTDKNGYPLTINYFEHNLTVENCQFASTVRGINVALPTSGKTYKFLNNTFELNQIKTVKAERKDNAIQFNAGEGKVDYSTIDETSTKVIVQGNTVKKANSFIQLHATFCFKGKGEELNYTNGENAFNKLSKILTVEGNTVMNNIPLVQGDPGVQTDLIETGKTQATIDSEQQQMDGYVATITGLVK